MNTAVVSVEEQLKNRMAALKGQITAPPSNQIRTKGKKFTLPDGTSQPGPLYAIVVDFNWVLAHYPGVYNPNNPQKPDCWAMSREDPDKGGCKAHETIKKPYGEDCATCEKNQWPKGGGGKACKNQRKVLLFAPDATEKSEGMVLFVSPGAIRNFDGFLTKMARDFNKDIVEVVTEISFDPNKEHVSLKFGICEDEEVLKSFGFNSSGFHGQVGKFLGLAEKHQALLWKEIATE